MKKMILSVMLSALVALTSCNTSDQEQQTETGNDVRTTFNVQSPVQTRSTEPTRYIVEAYEANDLSSAPLRAESALGNLTLTLKKGTEYTFLFWADNGTAAAEGVASSGYYNTTSLKAVEVTTEKLNTVGERAYCSMAKFNSNDFEANKNIILKNAVAEVNLVEGAGLTHDNNTITVTYANKTSFNVATGATTDVATEVTRTFSAIGKAAKGAIVATDYVLAPQSDKAIANIKVQMNSEPQKSVTNVPFQCGYKTNITGEFSNMYGTSFSVSNEVDSWGATTDKDLVNPPTKTVNINGVDFKFILVKAGTFEMGSPTTESGYQSSSEKLSWVKITKDYYIGETEVTQEQWTKIMGTNPSENKLAISPDLNTDNYPVDMVSWLNVCGGTFETSTVEPADCFLTKLTVAAHNQHTFRLPTSAEWEYAARGGHKKTTYMAFPGTDDINTIGDYAWCLDNSFYLDVNRSHRVATKKPNVLGLYDMAGNISEWCSDLFTYFPPIGTVNSPLIDPQGPETSSYERITRGGSYLSQNKSDHRNASVGGTKPSSRDFHRGLRLVMLP